MVRDHDHETGFIRGLLCDECNVWLGIYEFNLRSGQRVGKKRYWRWAEDYAKQISIHLTRNTGVIYHPLAFRRRQGGSAEYRNEEWTARPRPKRKKRKKVKGTGPVGPIKSQRQIDAQRALDDYRARVPEVPRAPKKKKVRPSRERISDKEARAALADLAARRAMFRRRR